MLNILRRNLGVKIISLLFAILFWLFVLNQGTTDTIIPEQTVNIPLVSSGLDPNMILMTQLPVVRVRYQGVNPSANIRDIYGEIDLSAGVLGESTYTIKVNTPPGINVVDRQPSTIKLTLDKVQEKTIPVDVIVSGNPATDYQLSSPIVKPSAVNVRGPSTILSKMEKVTVEVNATGVSDTIQISRPVSFRDKEGKPISGPFPSLDILNAYPSSVEVIVPVIPKALSSKMVPIKVTSSGNPAPGKELRTLIPTPASVTILGSPEALKGVSAVNIGTVDISNLSEDKTIQIPLEKVSLPQGISFLNGTNFSVVVQIGDGPIQKTIQGVSVQVRNVGADLEVDQINSPIDVIIEGPADILKNVTSDQIQLWVDANGLKAGSYPNSKVYWQLPAGVTMPTTPQINFSLKARAVKGAE